MSDDLSPTTLQQATEHFRRAHFHAMLQDWLANLTGRDANLLSYDEVRRILRAREQPTRPRLEDVPLEKIVGSVGRYRDFNRAFLPRNEALLERWRRVDAAMNSPGGVPPVELYKVGELYFVRDGNHRVSVARSRGDKTIEAYVTPVQAPFPVEAGNADELARWLSEAGYRLFLERTKLREHFPDADLRLTEPGRYRELDEQIAVHRWYMGENQRREIPYDEAVKSWYENVYLPLANAIRESGVLKEFPNRTVTDLFLWICRHREELKRIFNLDLDEEAAVSTFASVYSDKPLKKALKGARLKAARLVGGDKIILGIPEREKKPSESAKKHVETEREGGG
ncbi:MAG: transcriptional regulator [Chloroflexi bacterium]|nr:transcriptional regulator [Chloroflexota bacterium]